LLRTTSKQVIIIVVFYKCSIVIAGRELVRVITQNSLLAGKEVVITAQPSAKG